MLKEAAKYPAVIDHLPDSREVHSLPRQFIANLVYTLAKEPFLQWVEGQIHRRNSKLIANNNMAIEMAREYLRNCEADVTHLSCLLASHGTGVHLLKAGTKRRRNKAEMEKFKHEEVKKEEVLSHARQRIDQLEGQLMETREQ